jgi:hypothetical protein
MCGNDNSELDAVEMWRCPQLGGPVTFGYCRVMNEGRLCQRTVKCWGGVAEVAAFLEGHYSTEELTGAQATDRVTRIVDAVRGVKGDQGPQA